MTMCAYCDRGGPLGWFSQTGLPICKACCVENLAKNLGISEELARKVHEEQHGYAKPCSERINLFKSHFGTGG